MREIWVRPFGDRAWQVAVSGAEPALYSSGARAESAARRLAQRLALQGEASELTIVARSGWIATRSRTEVVALQSRSAGQGPARPCPSIKKGSTPQPTLLAKLYRGALSG